MRVRVPPRDVAAEVTVRSIAPIGWAVAAITLVLCVPVLIETLALSRHLDAAPLPVLMVVVMLLCLGVVVWRPRPRTVCLYLAVGFVATVVYGISLLHTQPGLAADNVYLLNRPAVALALVGLAARTPVIGIAWTALAFAVSSASALTTAVLAGIAIPFRPGYGPLMTISLFFVAYLTLWRVQARQRRMLPNVDELEAENAVLARGEDLARRTTAAVHDTLLNDLAVVMNAPDHIDERAQRQLRVDLETLSGAEWLRASPLPEVDQQDTALRNEIMTIISGFQWRGLSVHVTGSGNGIYQFETGTASAILDALTAALENVLRHSGANVADVELVYGSETLTVMVTDEGVGFDVDAVASDRLGIRASIEDRIAGSGGTVRIWSSPGAGTSIAMTVPFVTMVRGHQPTKHRELS